jgi:hypothetical protein
MWAECRPHEAKRKKQGKKSTPGFTMWLDVSNEGMEPQHQADEGA